MFLTSWVRSICYSVCYSAETLKEDDDFVTTEFTNKEDAKIYKESHKILLKNKFPKKTDLQLKEFYEEEKFNIEKIDMSIFSSDFFDFLGENISKND